MFYKTSKVNGVACQRQPVTNMMHVVTESSKMEAFPVNAAMREDQTASLEHAYHHLNFAWNGRFKTMREADAQFDRNEKFPYPHGAVGRFAKFWPKTTRTSQ